MLKVRKVLNNNALLSIDTVTLEEIIFIGNGVGFNQKVNMPFTPREGDAVYRHDPKVDLSYQISKIDPVFLEITSAIIEEASHVFENLDRRILLPLSDHIAFAIERIKSNLIISNPYAHDASLLFEKEYAVALKARQIILDKIGIMINDEEVGYITLHIHSARGDDEVSESMLFAVLINEAIQDIETTMNIKINKRSLSYSRLLTHMKYMIARAKKQEKLTIDMDHFVKSQFLDSYELSEKLIKKMEEALNFTIDPLETAYFALHIQKICTS